MRKSIIAILLALSSQFSQAGDYQNPVIRDDKPKQYMVSGMLKANTGDVVIKLVQAIVKAHNPDEANGKFLAKVMGEYKGYGMLSSIVTQVQESKDGCETWL